MSEAPHSTPRRLLWLAEVPFVGLPHRQPILARLLAQRFDTLYVEPPASGRLPRSGVTRRDGLRVAQVAPLLNAHPPLLRSAMANSRARRVGEWLAWCQLQRVLQSQDWARHPNELVVVCSNVYMAAAVRTLRPRLCVMDLCDDPRHYPGEPEWTHALLGSLARTADIMTTSSFALLEEMRSMGARQPMYLPNGIGEELLRRGLANRPDRMRSSGRVVGFIGHFGTWVDFELLEQLATALPSKILRLVGPVDPAAVDQLNRVLAHPGVEYVPQVPYAEVWRMLATFDVGIIPFRITPYTRAVNPVKLYEYAAFNLPIVSTAFSPDVAQFAPTVDVVHDRDAFVRVVQQRLRGEDLRDTRWIASAHTWDASAQTLTSVLEQAPAELQ